MSLSIADLIRRNKIRSLSPKSTKLEMQVLESREVPTGVYSGVVFQDYNSNGARDLTTSVTNTGGGTVSAAVDRGVGGVTVTAFNVAGTSVGSTVTLADGTFSFTPTGAGPYRFEFSSLPTGFQTGPRGIDSGSTVQFRPDGGSTDLNTGIVIPNDYSVNNPLVATNTYLFGASSRTTPTTQPNDAPNAALSALSGQLYSYGGTTNFGNPTSSEFTVPYSQLGATFGLGFDRFGRNLYNSSYTKRHTGYGPGATAGTISNGVVYRIPVPTGASGALTATPYADLNAIFGANTAGVNHRLGNPTGTPPVFYDYDRDRGDAGGNQGWDAVGKTSLGGLDVSDDGQFIFVMNLADRQLYRIPTGVTPTAGNIVRTSIPLTNPSSTVIPTADFQSSNLRPFAVEFHNGRVYVGVVYSAETKGVPGDQAARDQLLAAVYEVNPATMAFNATPVYTQRLNYTRSGSPTSFVSDTPNANWEPWSSTFFRTGNRASDGVAPQPILTGITFDSVGNMTLGIRDRGADQFGNNQRSSPLDDALYEGFTSGDILRTSINTVNNYASGWTSESNGRVVNNLTSSPAQLGTAPQTSVSPTFTGSSGPGGAEFYWQDFFNTFHQETSMGGTGQVPGFPDVVLTAMDPGARVNSGGFSWLSSLTGEEAKAYDIYVSAAGGTNASNFAKANGLSEPVFLLELPSIEIGDRVFADNNLNGIQDANEAGIDDVVVFLVNAGGVTIASATTANGGIYRFSNAVGIDGPGETFGVGLTKNTTYTLRFGDAANYAGGGKLAGLQLSPADQGSDDIRDSDAKVTGTPAAGNQPSISVTTGSNGFNVHTFDTGFGSQLSIGNVVWNDLNNNGTLDGAEVGISGVAVNLYFDADNNGTITGAEATTPFKSTVTTGGGLYLFNGLSAGKYIVGLDASNFTGAGKLVNFVSSSGKFASLSGPFEAAPLAGVDNKDNGTINGTLGTGGDIRSPLINLQIGTAPENENPNNDPSAPDKNTNLTIDFGVYQPLGIGNLVFNDANNNGVRDVSEAGLAGITVDLMDAAGTTVLATTLTDAKGNYLFPYLTENTYRVRIALPTGTTSSTGTLFSATGPVEGAPAPSNNDNKDNGSMSGLTFAISGPLAISAGSSPTGETPSVLLPNPIADANSNLTFDFGIFSKLSIGNQVWLDLDNSGTINAADGATPGISGAIVELLYDANNDGNFTGAELTPVLTTATVGGLYLFDNLIEGKYRVQLPASNFTGSGVLVGHRSSTGAPGASVGPNEPSTANTTDGNDDGTLITGGIVVSNLVTLTVGGAPTQENPNNDTGKPDGNADLTVDFGFVPMYSIGNRVWRDVDSNGTINAADGANPGIGGVTVNVYNAANVLVGTTTTDPNGYYLVDGLLPGDYVVEVVTTAAGLLNLGPTTAGGDPDNNTDSDSNGVTTGVGFVRSLPVTLGPANSEPTGEDVGPAGNGAGLPDSRGNLTVDFGFTDAVYSVGGNIYYDAGNDGARTGDTLITSSVTLVLTGTDSSGPITPRTITTTNGTYNFTALRPGTYTVTQFNQPTTHLDGRDTPGAPYGGTGTAAGIPRNPRDADAITGIIIPVASPNLSGTEYNFGELLPASLGDFVWLDQNGNGLQDGTEPGVGNVRVVLTGTDDTGVITPITVSTTGTGAYNFNNLRPGTYTVTFGNSDGTTTYTRTIQNSTAPGNTLVNDSNAATATGIAPSVTLVAGQNDPTIDAGLYVPVSVGDTVWYDINSNGTQQAGEPGIPGVTVVLNYAGIDGVFGTADDVANFASKVTDATGNYNFTGLAPGLYQAVVQTGTVPSGLTANTTPTSQNTPTLLSGQNDPLRDFGFVGKASLGDRVWLDTDSDGLQDATNEPGLIGVEMKATWAGFNGTFGDADDVTFTTTTAADGKYLFSNLPGGNFKVLVTPSTLPVNVSQTFDLTAPTNDNSATRLLGNTEDARDVDFGYVGNASIGDTVWYDVDANQTQNNAEPGIPNAKVVLTWSGNDNTIGTADDATFTTTTDATGKYLFPGLPVIGAGSKYQVVVTPPVEYTDQTFDATAPTTDKTSGLTLTPAEANRVQDFGFRGPLSQGLGNFVWLDANGNGKQDTGETGVNGVTVDLLDATGNLLTTTKTVNDGSGKPGFYEFRNLIPGTYGVRFGNSDGTTTYIRTAQNSPVADNTTNSDANATTGLTANVTLAAAEFNPNIDAGLYLLANIGDRVWYDTDNDGVQDPTNEPGITGAKVTVTYFGLDGQVGGGDDQTFTATTGANGIWTLTGLVPGKYTAVADPSTATNAPAISKATTPTSVTANPTSGQTIDTMDFGFVAGPASIGDRVWFDGNKNGVQDATNEPGFAGVPVSLIWAGQDGILGNADDVNLGSTTTGADGKYLFENLPYGKYQVQVTTPPSNLAATFDLDSLLVSPDSKAVAVVDAANPNRRDVDFGYAGLANVGDRTFLDQNRDNVQQATEPGLPGAVVELRLAGTDGVIDTADDLLLTATTGANGIYNFTNLPVFGVDLTDPFRVTVVAPPAGLVPVGDLDGTTTPNVTNEALGATQTRTDVDFGYDGTASISGTVYVDNNDNGQIDAGEPRLPGTIVTLTGTDSLGNPVLDPLTGNPYTATTDAQGNYLFDNLPAGLYRINETQPTRWNDGKDTAGNLGGTTTNDQFAEITIPAGGVGTQYNFGERGTFISGTVFRDEDGDGVQDPGEPAIPGTIITLIDPANGTTLGVATTDAQGNYRFDNLPIGSYRIVETQPVGYGNSPGTPATVRDVVVPLAGLPNQNFGEQLGSLAGFVYEDYNLDGTRTTTGVRPDAPIPGITVTLVGTDANGPVNRTTTTGADGSYLFANLFPGSYRVIETQPRLPVTIGDGGYYDALDNIGSLGGAKTIKNEISTIPLAINADGTAQNGVQYNFGELPPADPNGFVFVDANNNGIFDAGENPIAGVTITLAGTVTDIVNGAIGTRPLTAADVPGGLTRVTDSKGFYEFLPIRPGTYSLTQTQPANFFDGREQNGDTNPPNTVVVENDRFSNIVTAPFQIRGPFNFGELLASSIAGTVFVDNDGNGRLSPADQRIPNTVVTLTGTDDLGAAVNRTLTTDANGNYNFGNLRPGVYRLVETQPAPFRQGPNTIGSSGGTLTATDTVSTINLNPGTNATDYNFGELLPRPAMVPGLPPVPPVALPPVAPPVGPSKRQFLSSDPLTIPPGTRDPLPTGRTEPNYNALGSINSTRLSQYLATSNGRNGSTVRVFDMTQGQERFRLTPFAGTDATQGARTATADFNNDAIPDIVAAAGPGGSPRVIIYDGVTGGVIQDFLVFEASFTGGLYIATGDFNADGRADLIVTPDQGGGPRVRVFSGGNPNAQLADFFGIEDPNFRGGARAAAGDLNGDGRDDLIVSAGFGGGPRVSIYNGTSIGNGQPQKLTADFFVYETTLRNGVFVTAGDVDGDGRSDLIVGAGPGGGPRVSAFSGSSLIATGTLNPIANFFAGDANRRLGVNVSAKDFNGDGRVEIVTGTAFTEIPIVRIFNPLTGTQIDEFYADNANFPGSVFVG
ncbi:MAG: SdrD B-like domain-containing protein [Fimbriiglobus sp.]